MKVLLHLWLLACGWAVAASPQEQAAEEATHEGNSAAAHHLDKRIEDTLLGIDRRLASHPTHRLERWLTFARNHGSTPALRDSYERNARRLFTIWGPPVDDYAAKVWSGLIRDYYLPRWQQYRKHGKHVLPEWERHWVEDLPGLSPAEPYAAPTAAAQQLLARAREDVSHAAHPSEQGAP